MPPLQGNDQLPQLDNPLSPFSLLPPRPPYISYQPYKPAPVHARVYYCHLSSSPCSTYFHTRRINHYASSVEDVDNVLARGMCGGLGGVVGGWIWGLVCGGVGTGNLGIGHWELNRKQKAEYQFHLVSYHTPPCQSRKSIHNSLKVGRMGSARGLVYRSYKERCIMYDNF